MVFRRRLFLTIAILGWLSLVAWPASAAAGHVRLAWDRNPEPRASYIVAYGTEPGSYTRGIDVGTQISTTITNLQDGVRYYFVVYAYIYSAISPASQEVSAVVQPGGKLPSNWQPQTPGPPGPNNLLGDMPIAAASAAASIVSSTVNPKAIGGSEDCTSALLHHAQWGEPGLAFVPGDYDGDGSSDCAIWRASVGLWRVFTSSAGYGGFVDIAIGSADDVTVPADYDGDGRTDVAVWNTLTGVWSVRTSSSLFANGFSVQWGTGGDIPVVDDYDGDGRADLGLWRPSATLYEILLSRGNYAATHSLTLND
jgi:hypothetical protein